MNKKALALSLAVVVVLAVSVSVMISSSVLSEDDAPITEAQFCPIKLIIPYLKAMVEHLESIATSIPYLETIAGNLENISTTLETPKECQWENRTKTIELNLQYSQTTGASYAGFTFPENNNWQEISVKRMAYRYLFWANSGWHMYLVLNDAVVDDAPHMGGTYHIREISNISALNTGINSITYTFPDGIPQAAIIDELYIEYQIKPANC